MDGRIDGKSTQRTVCVIYSRLLLHLLPSHLPSHLPSTLSLCLSLSLFLSHLALPPSLLVGPILVVEPRPVTVDLDSDVTLNCKWSGNPPLTLTWTKKGSSMVRTRLTRCTHA